MSQLRIYAETRPQEPIFASSDGDEIASKLGEIGVRFERWQASQPLAPGADQDSVIAAYRHEIDRICAEEGYTTVDVISMTPDHPDRAEMRTKFLEEHYHQEDEVRFFVDGSGLFTLHIDDQVYEIECVRDDLISVPDGTPHWFDMGPTPHFTAIRFFQQPDGWIGHFTGSDIAGSFPRYEAPAFGGVQ